LKRWVRSGVLFTASKALFWWRIAICIGISALAHPASANLFVNGDFELVGPAPGSPASTYTTDYAAISTNTLTGWTSSVDTVAGAGNYISTAGSSADWIPNPISGNYCIQLDSSQTTDLYTVGNSVSQTVNLTAGLAYQLTFYMSAEAARGQPVTSKLDVILNGSGFTNFTTEFTASRPGNDTKATMSDWIFQTLNFTATTSGAVNFTFLDMYVANGTSSNSALDNIDLSVVPEFSNGMIVTALCALLVFWQSRRRVTIMFRTMVDRVRRR
jgi:Protein of unknown function (DUF642)